MDTSIAVASEWIEEGTVVKERYSDDRIKTYETQGKHRLAGIPTIVLVDGGSASGSEIVAGALQDHGVATLVGAQTYGKGSVQDFDIFPDGSALKLTIAKWYTPNDRQIDDEGIAPDVIVDQMFRQPQTDGGSVTDAGLEKAMELLTSPKLPYVFRNCYSCKGAWKNSWFSNGKLRLDAARSKTRRRRVRRLGNRCRSNIYGCACYYGRPMEIEVHLLDYSGKDIYGELLTVEPVQKVSEIETYSSTEELIKKIQQDLVMVRDLLTAKKAE